MALDTELGFSLEVQGQQYIEPFFCCSINRYLSNLCPATGHVVACKSIRRGLRSLALDVGLELVDLALTLTWRCERTNVQRALRIMASHAPFPGRWRTMACKALRSRAQCSPTGSCPGSQQFRCTDSGKSIEYWTPLNIFRRVCDDSSATQYPQQSLKTASNIQRQSSQSPHGSCIVNAHVLSW